MDLGGIHPKELQHQDVGTLRSKCCDGVPAMLGAMLGGCIMEEWMENMMGMFL